MASGKIVVYNETTCQEARTLQHQEAVRILRFGKRTDILASTGLKVVRMWETSSWDQLWEFEIAQQCLTIAFMEEQELLLGALRNNTLMVWDLVTGTLRDSADWTLDLEGPNRYAFRRPIAAAICAESSLLAVVYRGQDILLWDLARDSLHETYCKETGVRSPGGPRNSSPGATGLIFSLLSNAGLLAASYSDGDLVLFDTSESTVRATTLANAQTLACSPDGRTLACGNSTGTIQLFDFETLKLLYRINSDDYGIRELAFNGDSHRLLDIRGSQCRVWDPTVLVRQDAEEKNSDTISVSTAAQEISLESSDNVNPITSLVCHGQDRVAFCGKENGSVYLYETKSGRQSQKLFSHAHGFPILSLYLNEETHALSSIASTQIMVHRLVRREDSWDSGEALLDHCAGVAVDQVLSNKGSTRLLVCTAKKDTLWSISSDESTIVNELPWEGRESYKWGIHPSRQDHLILITQNIAHVYEWQALQRLTGAEGILLGGSILPELFIRSITPCLNGTVVATTFSDSSRPQSEPKLLLWDSADFSALSESAVPIPRYRSLAEQVKTLIGECGQKLVFLHSSTWVCSANLQSPSAEDFARHFFLPTDWLSTNVDLMFGVTNNGDILFVKRDEIAVIKRGLENVELGSDVPGKRPSLLGGNRPSLQVPESF